MVLASKARQKIKMYVHPQAVERSIIEHGMAWGGMEANLLGKPLD